MCDSKSDNGLRGRPYHRGNLPTLFAEQKCVDMCVCVFFYIPFPEFNLLETIKETRQMAYPHCLI